ncbi:MAG TPA: hypothetical protein PKW14_08250 [Bacteroidota bacterium]|nr:hypothetical protein [Bacteroidota bacterium]
MKTKKNKIKNRKENETKVYNKMFMYDENGNKLSTSQRNKLILDKINKDKSQNKEVNTNLNDDNYKNKYSFRKYVNVVEREVKTENGIELKKIEQVIECDFDYDCECECE